LSGRCGNGISHYYIVVVIWTSWLAVVGVVFVVVLYRMGGFINFPAWCFVIVMDERFVRLKSQVRPDVELGTETGKIE